MRYLTLIQDNIEEYATIEFVVSAELLVTPSPSRTPILTTGEIIGIAVGGAVFLILVTTLLLIFFIWLVENSIHVLACISSQNSSNGRLLFCLWVRIQQL